jgi:hypothetical protein
MNCRVKTYSVGGRKDVFFAGQIVTESDFEEGLTAKLVEDGFLTPESSDDDILKEEIEAEEKSKKKK